MYLLMEIPIPGSTPREDQTAGESTLGITEQPTSESGRMASSTAKATGRKVIKQRTLWEHHIKVSTNLIRNGVMAPSPGHLGIST